jgi:hypothetical protein
MAPSKETAFVNFKELDTSRISFGEPQKNRNNTGAKSIPIFYDGVPLYIRLPKMYVSTFFDAKDNPNKFSLNVALEPGRESIERVIQMLNDIDDRVLDAAEANNQLWFRQNITKESLKFLYTQTIRKPSDAGKYPPSFRPAVYAKDNKLNIDVYDAAGGEVKEFVIDAVKGCDVSMLVQLSAVWVISGKLGISYKVTKMRVYPREKAPAMRINPSDAIRFQDVNIKGISFSAPRGMGGSDGKIVYVNHGDKPLVIRTPKMVTPFGVQVYPDRPDSKPYIELSFRDESDPTLIAFKDFVTAFDNRVRVEIEKEGWFKAPNGTSAVYSSMLHQGNPEYPPVLKASFQLEDGQIVAPITNINGTPFGLHELARRLRNAQVTAVLQCTGVWCTGGKAGVSFRVLELVAQPSANAIECNFDDDEDSAALVGGDGDAAAGGEEEDAESVRQRKEYVIDSDDDL